MLSGLLLSLFCIVSLLRPFWGLISFLVLSFSLFQLGQFFIVIFPVGHLGLSDVGVLCIFLGAYAHRKSYLTVNEKKVLKIIFHAVIPLIIWMFFCILLGGFTFGIKTIARMTFSYIIPFTIIFSIWFMRNKFKKILLAIFIISTITAFIHIVINMFDLRLISYYAYNGFLSEKDSGISGINYIRYFPQSTDLIRMSFVFFFSYLLIKKMTFKKTIIIGLLTSLLFISIFITLTRNLIAGFFLISILSIIFSYKLKYAVVRRTRNISILVLLFLIIMSANSTFQKTVINKWEKRMYSFGISMQIYKNITARGRNNIESFNYILKSPIWGYGIHSISTTWVRDKMVGDIHPIIKMGLIAGITGIILILRLYISLFLKLLNKCKRNVENRGDLFPYLMIILYIIISGFINSSYTDFANIIFLGLMSAQLTFSLQTKISPQLNIGINHKL